MEALRRRQGWLTNGGHSIYGQFTNDFMQRERGCWTQIPLVLDWITLQMFNFRLFRPVRPANSNTAL